MDRAVQNSFIPCKGFWNTSLFQCVVCLSATRAEGLKAVHGGSKASGCQSNSTHTSTKHRHTSSSERSNRPAGGFLHNLFAKERDHPYRVVRSGLDNHLALLKKVTFFRSILNGRFHLFRLLNNVFAVPVFAPLLNRFAQPVSHAVHVRTGGKRHGGCITLQPIPYALCACCRKLLDDVGSTHVGCSLVVSKAQRAASDVAHGVKGPSVNVDVVVLLAVVDVLNACGRATKEATACASHLIGGHQIDAALSVT